MLAGEVPVTQFGRAMRNLKVILILAHSPQAKGRVERVNGTLQDRLVKALRLAKVNDIDSANRLLETSFLVEFNKQFVVPARSKSDAHRAVGKQTLEREMCEHHERKVGQDWCVQWRGGVLQIDKKHARLKLAGKSVTIRERGGEVELAWSGQRLSWERVKARPKRTEVKAEIRNNKKWQPGVSHPWRAPAAGASSPTAPQPRQQVESRTFL